MNKLIIDKAADEALAALDAAETAAQMQPITTVVEGAPTPAEMLKRARAAGKTEDEINKFAASQPMKPIAVKGARVFVQDCFGRTFGLDDVPEAELAALVNKGVPYTPYSNRHEVRTDARLGGPARNAHAPMTLPPRATLRELQKQLAVEAAPLRASLTPQLRAVLANIERGTKVSRKEYDALVAGVAKVKESGREFGDVLAARMQPVELAVHAASAALSVDDATVARILEVFRAAKEDAPVPGHVRQFEVEDAAQKMIELARDATGTRIERLGVALDELDNYKAFRPGLKGKALELFLARYEREVENEGAAG